MAHTEYTALKNMLDNGVFNNDATLDAVQKFRISQPQALIDTDFEYSLQGTKWELLNLNNNTPSVFARANEPAYTADQITSITVSLSNLRDIVVKVNIVPEIPFAVGNPIVIKESSDSTYVDGAYVIKAIFGTDTFVVTSKSPAPLLSGLDFRTDYTAIYTGDFYSNSQLLTVGISSLSGTKDAVLEFVEPHALFLESPITVIDTNQSGAPWIGSFTIKKVLSDTKVTFETDSLTNFTDNSLLVNPVSGGKVFARGEGVSIHRFFDGGVQINPGTAAPNAQIIRQTRKYFRYQSGKGMQFSTGILFKPVYEVVDAYTSNNAYLSSIYLSAVNIVSEGSNKDDINETYVRPPSSSFFTPLTGIYDNTISYNISAWELYSNADGEVVAKNTSLFLDPAQWEVLPGYEAAYAPLAATTNIEEDPTYPYYDFYVTTEQYHGFTPVDPYRLGAIIEFKGFQVTNGTNPYDRQFEVAEVVNSKTFKVQIPVSEFNPFPTTDFNPGGIVECEVKGWNDATVRTGMFDDQSGLFFECDGKEIVVVRRYSTTPTSGTVNVETGKRLITSFDGNTKFTTQFQESDYCVIKGQTYSFSSMVNDLSAYIVPAYRGVSVQNVKIYKTLEERYRQSEFNLDKLDGTGPSGYVLDLSRMQMIFLDYSWYGAGKVRFGIRANDGKIIYFHEIYNNNTNRKAYMRSGNLPGRFEIQSRSKTGTLLTALSTDTLSALVSQTDAQILPERGRIIVNNEYIKYSKTTTELSGGLVINFNERNSAGLEAGPVVTIAGDGFISYNQNCSPALSHWGVSVIMDGKYDVDKSYLFTATTSTAFSATSAEQALLSVRLAPSVDYGIPGPFGVRNLINRSLLTLKNIGVVATQPIQVVVKINAEHPSFYVQSNWDPASNGSIAQYLDHTVKGSFESAGRGGDVIASYFVVPQVALDNGNSVYGSGSFDIDIVRELSNSILGGGGAHPDGPDILTVFVKTFDGTTSLTRARVSWTEAQG